MYFDQRSASKKIVSLRFKKLMEKLFKEGLNSL